MTPEQERIRNQEIVIYLLCIALLALALYVFNGGKLMTSKSETYYANRNRIGASILQVN